jgi:hypothetical protein
LAIHWFANCDSARSAVTEELKTTVETTQTIWQSSYIVPEFMTSHVPDDLNIINMYDDRSSNGSKEKTSMKRFTHINRTK